MKINPRSKSSGQILVIVIIVLVLVGIGFWWLDSEQAADGKGGQRIWEERDPGARRSTQCEIFCGSFEPRNASAVSAVCTTGSHDPNGSSLERRSLLAECAGGDCNFSHTFLSQTATSTRTSIIRRGELRSTSPFPIRSVVGKLTRSHSRRRAAR